MGDAKRSHKSSADEVSYAKSAGSPSTTGNAPYWPEGSPMIRGTSKDREENKEGSPMNREENKNERSRGPRDLRNFSNSSDKVGKGHETMTKKSHHRRSRSMGVESQ